MNGIQIIIYLHIAAGFLALSMGIVALITRKGGRGHTNTGRVFFYSMLVVAASAIVVSLVKNELFLLYIAFFGLYQNLVGYQSIQNKTLLPGWKEYVTLGLGAATSAIMLQTGNVVLLVFGGICAFLVVGEIRMMIRIKNGIPLRKLAWLSRHIGNMMGAFIATVTAFVVVNVRDIEPTWIPWLLPTFVLVPLMQYYQWKFIRKFK